MTSTESHEECEILAGPNYTVAGPSGALTLTAGTSVSVFDGFVVETDATLTIGIDPNLQISGAWEAAARAGWVPPESEQ